MLAETENGADQFWVLDLKGRTLFTCDGRESPKTVWWTTARDALVQRARCRLQLTGEGVELTAWRMSASEAGAVGNWGGNKDGNKEAIALRVTVLVGATTHSFLGPSSPAGIDNIMTPRQTEVSEYAASGATVGEIASHLGISAETVRSHLKTVYRNLGIANRVELARAMGELRA